MTLVVPLELCGLAFSLVVTHAAEQLWLKLQATAFYSATSRIFIGDGILSLFVRSTWEYGVRLSAISL